MSDRTTNITTAELGRALERVQHATYRMLFGDRLGLLVFLVILAFVGTYWRMGIVINDNETLANGVHAVMNGHLTITDPIYGGPKGAAPGTKYHEGTRYAREYGLVVPSAILALVLDSLRTIFALRVLLVGGWCLVVFGAILEISRFLDRSRTARLVGGIVVLLVLAGNIALAPPITDDQIPLLGLQLWTILVSGLIATVAYRLFALEFSRGAAAAVGASVVLATPVGFWASIPKRHVVVTFAVLVVAYAFARRPSMSGFRGRLLRALPYATAAGLLWVHPGDGGILVAAVVFVDVAFGSIYDRSQVALTGGIVALSILPFFLTNYVISGNPIRAPQYLPAYTGQPISVPEQAPANGIDVGVGAEWTGTGVGGSAGTTSKRPSSPSLLSMLRGVIQAVSVLVLVSVDGFEHWFDRAIRVARMSLDVFVMRPESVFQTFVRSGFLERPARRGADDTINLSYLESFPVFGAALVGGVHAVVAERSMTRALQDRRIAFRDADGDTRSLAFAVTYVGLMVLFYQSRLPLHTTVTVRFLVPTMPLALLIALRLPGLRDVLEMNLRTVLLAYLSTVLVGGELLAGFFVASSLSLGEAMQLHALLALAVSIPLAIWALSSAFGFEPITRERWYQAGAILLGTAAGVTTVFVLLTGWLHFPYGEYAIPLFDALSELLRT